MELTYVYSAPCRGRSYARGRGREWATMATLPKSDDHQARPIANTTGAKRGYCCVWIREGAGRSVAGRWFVSSRAWGLKGADALPTTNIGQGNMGSRAKMPLCSQWMRWRGERNCDMMRDNCGVWYAPMGHEEGVVTSVQFRRLEWATRPGVHTPFN